MQMNRPCGPERVHVVQRSAKNVLVEEGDGVEGLVLGAGGHAASQGQLGQESFELLLAGQGGRYTLQGADVAPRPMNIGFLGRQRHVLAAYDLPHSPDCFGPAH